jgi:hypothetical protein
LSLQLPGTSSARQPQTKAPNLRECAGMFGEQCLEVLPDMHVESIEAIRYTVRAW